MNIIGRSILGFRQFVFPRNCPGCQRSMMKWEATLCRICWSKLPVTEIQKGKDSLLQARLSGRANLFQAHAMMRFYQGGLAQKLLHAIKYQGKKRLATDLGKKFGEILNGQIEITSSSILVPVPLHPFKLQIRGFNQSEKIAEGISESLGIPVSVHAMERIKFHVSQTKKGKEARWEEIKNDFVAKSEEVRHRDIILVDDVCTSGATIEACAKALLEKGVKSISLLTLAVAGENYQ